jgi:hypothetical protein
MALPFLISLPPPLPILQSISNFATNNDSWIKSFKGGDSGGGTIKLAIKKDL